MQATGDASYNDKGWALWADASIEDYTLGVNADVYWWDELYAVGTSHPSESITFNYVFAEGDVGTIFEISMYIQTEISGGGPWITGGDTLAFSSDFYHSLRIDSISGGIETVDGPDLVPIPAAVWLLGSGLIGMLGIRRRLKN
ncbi:MAG: VPLPA-CTERM sorting domain-containing protein [Deltaproteobacteria bacterium]|nr:VPLPA-CTERM sorting domain-containing protein [Deltaproteobacteria bacterium]